MDHSLARGDWHLCLALALAVFGVKQHLR